MRIHCGEVGNMASVRDVAAYILNELAPENTNRSVTSWKLQKLVYYCQAWSLVWDERELFPEYLEAWADGPVCPDLYRLHRGKLHLRAGDIQGDPDALDETGIETIDAVLDFYGDKSGRYLSDLTHMERPWIEARGATPSGMPSQAVISREVMAEYYGAL